MLADKFSLNGVPVGLPVLEFVKTSFDARGTRYICTTDDSIAIYVGKMETKKRQTRIQLKVAAEQETVSASGAVGNTFATGSVVLTDFPIANDTTKNKVFSITRLLAEVPDLVMQIRRGEQ